MSGTPTSLRVTRHDNFPSRGFIIFLHAINNLYNTDNFSNLPTPIRQECLLLVRVARNYLNHVYHVHRP